MTLRTVLPGMFTTALLAMLASTTFAAVTINIINTDGAGEGFNDPTPAAPVGGNPGTTVGQQRLNCFTHAAAIWGSTLSSAVPINIQAAFNPLSCTSTSAVLGSAGPINVIANIPAFQFQNYWYHPALGSKQAGFDVDPGNNDINAQFNSNLGQVNCLSTSGWYYGFDHNEGGLIDLVDVLLHEFGHGLGFSTTTNGGSGAFTGGLPGLWDKFLYDETSGLHWDQMTAGQRAASAINTNNLTWDGTAVKNVAQIYLAHSAELGVTVGPGTFAANAAAFGAPLTLAGVTAPIVLVNDGVGTTTDGCETPFVNAAALDGKLALIDRGICTFTAKAKNAQNAGAVGVILVNNAAGALAPGGADPTISIPVIGISQADGATLKTALGSGPVTGSIRLSSSQVAGVHASGRVRMYAPSTFSQGSSVSHWDVSAVPNLLMEPAINADLSDNLDITRHLFVDIGWLPFTLEAPDSGPVARVALSSRPNPAHGSTSVHFELTSSETLELSLYDVTGRRVRTLARGTFTAGTHDVAWDGLDSSGRRAGPGIYLVRVNGTRTQASQHLVVVG